MSKDTKTSQDHGSSDLPETGQQDLPGEGAGKGTPPQNLPGNNQGKDRKRVGSGKLPEKKVGSKVHRLSQEKKPYTPKPPERIKPARMTADQYLRKATMDKNIADLVRSLHKTKVMTFDEWERTVATLIKKQTW